MWQYADYITLTDTAAQEVRLRLHIQEVSLKITANVNEGGSGRSSDNLLNLRKDLRYELNELIRVNGSTAEQVRFT